MSSLFITIVVTATMISSLQAAGEPRIRIATPGPLTANYSVSRIVPSHFEGTVVCIDDDAVGGAPAKWRTILVEAAYPCGVDETCYIDTEYTFNSADGASLLSFHNPAWGAWRDWLPVAEENSFVYELDEFDGEGQRIHYLLALQAMDQDGAVSTTLDYASTVHNIHVGHSTPSLHVESPILGESSFTGVYGTARYDVVSNQLLQFAWFGDSDHWGATVVSYRWGWDVSDVNDPMDPGWAMEPGLTPQHTATPEISFGSGIHTLTIECLDSGGGFTRASIILSVVPVPSLADRLPLLLIDDVADITSNGWPDQSGAVAYDRDQYRDGFWNAVLDGVEGWNADRDVFDTEETQSFGYRDAVNYRMLIWTTRFNTSSMITNTFAPLPGQDTRYVWLEPYQADVGNVFLVGGVGNFHPSGADGMPLIWPVIYDTDSYPIACNHLPYAMSFGTSLDVHGDPVVLGTTKYPFRTMGLSLVEADHGAKIHPCYDRGFDRKRQCNGTKALVVDPEWRAAAGLTPAIADTIYNWSPVDYEYDGVTIPDLESPFVFGFGEIYDFDTTARPESWAPQQLGDGSPAVVPMLRAMSRYDWIRGRHEEEGTVGWPDVDLASVCGEQSFDHVPAPGEAPPSVYEGAPVGFMSYATVATKPTGLADVMWGFDPHQFDHEAMETLLHWLLEEHFGLAVSR